MASDDCSEKSYNVQWLRLAEGRDWDWSKCTGKWERRGGGGPKLGGVGSSVIEALSILHTAAALAVQEAVLSRRHDNRLPFFAANKTEDIATVASASCNS